MTPNKPTYQAAITFESDTQPPKTARIEVRGTPGAALRQSLSAAKRAFPGSKWSSLSLTLTKTN